MSKVEGTCFVCLKTAPFRCESCDANIWFCRPGHGNYHRKLDGSCSPMKVASQKDVGRCTFATRDIKAGEVIFNENPIVVGPNNVTTPQCLVCTKKIVDTQFICHCLYPMCSETCQKAHVLLEECQRLQLVPKKSDLNYELILPLRLITHSDPDVRSLMATLMDHRVEKEANAQVWEHNRQSMVDPLTSILEGHFTSDDVIRAVGVVEVNNFEIYNPLDCGFRGIFPLTSLMSHSCTPNARHAIGRSAPWSSVCIASVDIPRGEEITITYVPLILCSSERRAKLKENWYFDCRCRRCLDPTELGTNLGGILCQACSPSGFLLPADSIDYNSKWICSRSDCQAELSAEECSQKVERLLTEKDHLDRKDIPGFLTFLQRAGEELHVNHYVLNSLRRWIVSLYCKSSTCSTITEEMLRSKVHLATLYLSVLNTIEPGLTRNRGRALYELAEAQLAILSLQLKSGSLDGTDFLGTLEECLERAQEAAQCLEHDTEGSFEAYIRHASSSLIQQIESFQRFLLK